MLTHSTTRIGVVVHDETNFGEYTIFTKIGYKSTQKKMNFYLHVSKNVYICSRKQLKNANKFDLYILVVAHSIIRS